MLRSTVHVSALRVGSKELRATTLPVLRLVRHTTQVHKKSKCAESAFFFLKSFQSQILGAELAGIKKGLIES